jgi:hypothetical protein
MAKRRLTATLCVSVSVSIAASACSSDASKPTEKASSAKTSKPDAGVSIEKDSAVSAEKDDVEPTAADFGCILDGTKVQSFYVKNRFGSIGDVETVATSDSGGTYPFGSVLQLIPTEAMVKRHAGYSPDTYDWEFFSLKVTGTQTEILANGTTEVLNAFNLNCLDCHQKADPKFDLVCEKTHGCDPLPFTDDQITAIQQMDSRCQKDAGR